MARRPGGRAAAVAAPAGPGMGRREARTVSEKKAGRLTAIMAATGMDGWLKGGAGAAAAMGARSHVPGAHGGTEKCPFLWIR